MPKKNPRQTRREKKEKQVKEKKIINNTESVFTSTRTIDESDLLIPPSLSPSCYLYNIEEELNRIKKDYDKKCEALSKVDTETNTKNDIYLQQKSDFEKIEEAHRNCLLNSESFSLYQRFREFTLDFIVLFSIKEDKSKVELDPDFFKRILKEERDLIEHHIPKITEYFEQLKYSVQYENYLGQYNEKIFHFSIDVNSDYRQFVSYARDIGLKQDVIYRIFCKNNCFDLTNIKNFFRTYIPNEVALPDTDEGLVSLWHYFFCSVLIRFITLEPVTSNFKYLKNNIQLGEPAVFCSLKVFPSLSFFKSTLGDKLENIRDQLNRITAEDDKNQLSSISELEITVVNVEKYLKYWKENFVKSLLLNTEKHNPFDLFATKDNETKINEVLEGRIDPVLLLFISDGEGRQNDFCCDIELIRYLYYNLRGDYKVIYEETEFLFSPEGLATAKLRSPVILENLSLGDFVILAYCIVYNSIIYRNFSNLILLKAEILHFKLLRVNTFIFSEKDKEETVVRIKEIEEEVTAFLKGAHGNRTSGQKIVDNIDIFLSKMSGIDDILDKYKTENLEKEKDSILTSITKCARKVLETSREGKLIVKKIQELLKENDTGTKELTNFITIHKKTFELRKQDVQKRLHSLSAKSTKKSKLSKQMVVSTEVEIKKLESLEELSNTLSKQLLMVENYFNLLQDKSKKQEKLLAITKQMDSAIGQVASSMQFLIKKLNNSPYSESLDFSTVSLKEILEKVEGLIDKKNASKKEGMNKIVKVRTRSKEKIYNIYNKLLTQYSQHNKEVEELVKSFSTSTVYPSQREKLKLSENIKERIEQYEILSICFKMLVDLEMYIKNQKEIGCGYLMELLLACNDGYHYKRELTKLHELLTKEEVSTLTEKAFIPCEKKCGVEREESESAITRIEHFSHKNNQFANQITEVNRDIIDSYNGRIIIFLSWQENWEIAKYPQLLKLFEEIAVLTPGLANLSLDRSAQLENYKKTLEEKQLELIGIIHWSESQVLTNDEPWERCKASVVACKKEIDGLLDNIVNSLHRLEWANQKIEANVSPNNVNQLSNFDAWSLAVWSLAVQYMAAMVDYNGRLDDFFCKQKKLSNLATELVKNNLLGLSLWKIIEQELLDKNSEFSKMNELIEQSKSNLITHWRKKEEIKSEFRAMLRNEFLFKHFASRIDPWGSEDQLSPVVASLTVVERVTTYVAAYPPLLISDSQSSFVTLPFVNALKIGLFRAMPPPTLSPIIDDAGKYLLQ